MKAQLQSILHPQNARNKMLRNNILLSSIIKIVGLCTSFLVVPITLTYLEPEQYGIWMTLSSILFWFSSFDVGLGNGMRNYLAEAIAKRDYQKGRSYIATTFIILSGIALLLTIILTCLTFFLDLNTIFNTHTLTNFQLRKIVIIACIFTLIMFVVKNIGLIYIAMQHYFINDLLIVLGNVLSLFLIYICTKLEPKGSLSLVVFIFTSIPVVLFIIGSIPLFRKYSKLKPTFSNFDLAFGKQMIKKGLGFFFIQITSCMVIFGSSNIFIIQYVGPEAVTTYNIAYKYFHLIAIAYTIILSPMWNAYTDAYVKKDFTWIAITFKRALFLWVISVIVGIFMLVFASYFYHYWIGDSLYIPWEVSASVLVYIIFFNLNNCVTYLINGLNKINIQIITSIITTIIYCGLAFTYGPLHGIVGISLSMGFCYAAMSMVHLYQCYKLIYQKATGIWNQ